MATPTVFTDLNSLLSDIQSLVFYNQSNETTSDNIQKAIKDAATSLWARLPQQQTISLLTGSSVGTTPLVLVLPTGGSIPVPLNSVVQFNWTLLGIVESIGITGNAYSSNYLITVKNTGGTLTLMGVDSIYVTNDSSLASTNITFSANNTTKCVDITIIGVGGTTIKWQAIVTNIQLSL